MTDKAKPTITLAELYENQNQYIDALVIYKNLYIENPTEELQNKIDELKDTIFKENTLEYSTIIDKIFTEEEKRTFHILPHEQYKAYTESQAEMKYEETYPEELTKVKEEKAAPEEAAPDETEEPKERKEETPDIENTIEPDVEIEDEESIELENTIDKDVPVDELTKEKEEELIPEVEKIPETPDIDDETEPEMKIEEDKTIEVEDTIEDDISLEIGEEISADLENGKTVIEPDTIIEDATSIEDIMKQKIKETKIDEQNEIIDDEETVSSEKSEAEIEPIIEPQNDNPILELLTKLSKMRPDIVERVLKENVGSDTALSEIKLSDLNYVIELLKVSNNVEED